jgi:hypothetical protein
MRGERRVTEVEEVVDPFMGNLVLSLGLIGNCYTCTSFVPTCQAAVAQYLDRLFQLADDSLLDLELQSTYTYEDVLRFGDYSWAAFRRHGKQTRTVVIYGPSVTTEPLSVVEAGGHTFRLTNVLLARRHRGQGCSGCPL